MNKKIDWTKSVQTPDRLFSGYAIKTDMKCDLGDGPVVVVLKNNCGGNEFLRRHGDDGHNLCGDRNMDLINVPERRVVWVNMHFGSTPGRAYVSKGQADEAASPARIACVRVEYEPGQFDEEVE